MKFTNAKAYLFCLLANAFTLTGASAFGAPLQTAEPLPFLSPIFGDNMVLQRGKPNSLWGWSRPRDTVRVTIGENSATAKHEQWKTGSCQAAIHHYSMLSRG